eukprot:323638-Rhodomonas_salina.1
MPRARAREGDFGVGGGRYSEGHDGDAGSRCQLASSDPHPQALTKAAWTPSHPAAPIPHEPVRPRP